MSTQKRAFGNYRRSRLVLMLIAIVSMSGCEKARLDEEVRRLCAKDGGVKVYETVILPPEKFDKFGVVSIPSQDRAKPNDDYFFLHLTKYYGRGNPEMWRDQFQIIRRTDGKILGEAVSYSRRGGDLPGPWQSSSFGCPAGADISLLKKQVFR